MNKVRGMFGESNSKGHWIDFDFEIMDFIIENAIPHEESEMGKKILKDAGIKLNYNRHKQQRMYEEWNKVRNANIQSL